MTGLVVDHDGRRASEVGLSRDELAETLYRRYSDALARYAGRLGSRDPEGVANLAVFDAVRHLPPASLLQEKAVRSYVYRAAHGHTVDEIRRRKPFVPVDPADIDGPADEETTNLDVSILLDEAIDELTAKEATVIRAKFLQGKTVEEIAGELGVKPNAVYQLQHRALARLRAYFAAALALVALAGLFGWLATIENSEPVDSTDQPTDSTPRSTERWLDRSFSPQTDQDSCPRSYGNETTADGQLCMPVLDGQRWGVSVPAESNGAEAERQSSSWPAPETEDSTGEDSAGETDEPATSSETGNDTIPELPGVNSTTVVELPAATSTTVPELPGVNDTIPELPGVTSTTVVELPAADPTIIPELPGVDDTIPVLPGVDDTIPVLPGI